LKRCSSCGREILESATVCADCESWASKSLTQSDSDTVRPESVDVRALDAVTPPASAISPSASMVAGHRPLMLTLCGGAAVAIIGFALMMARGTSSPDVAAAPAVAASARPPSGAAPPPRAATVKWTTDNRVFWVGKGSKAAAFEVAAENMVPIWMRQVRPILVVRCLSQSTDVFVFTASAMQMEPNTEDHTVSFSFDDEPPRTERWSDAADHNALFAPDGAAFAERLTRAGTLRFGYTPHNARPVTAQFQVSGLAEQMAPAARQCGSKK